MALVRVMPYWLLAACAMPVIVAVGRRFRLGRSLLRPNVLALVATAIGFAVLALAGRAALDTVIHQPAE